jgi:hypothetical protein
VPVTYSMLDLRPAALPAEVEPSLFRLMDPSLLRPPPPPPRLPLGSGTSTVGVPDRRRLRTLALGEAGGRTTVSSSPSAHQRAAWRTSTPVRATLHTRWEEARSRVGPLSSVGNAVLCDAERGVEKCPARSKSGGEGHACVKGARRGQREGMDTAYLV